MANDALATEQIREISLEDLVPGEGNRKHGGFDKAQLQELAESIKAVGILQPLVVRPIPGGMLYEIVAGERRFRAARLAGKDAVPCVVRDLDERTALMVRTVENLQRQDIHPLDEADGFLALRDVGGMEITQIAEQVGRSVPYVYQRLKLRDLVPAARKLLDDDEIQLGHALLLSRLSQDDQAALVKELREDRWERWTVTHLEGYIERELLMKLSAAPFKLKDAELVPAAGGCTTCPKRTGAQEQLFPELKKSDRCLDRACFNSKLDALVARRAQELEGTKYVRVHGEQVGYSGKQEVEAESVYDYRKASRDDKGAVPLLTVSGSDRGKVTYGKLESWAKPSRGTGSASVTERERRKKEIAEQREKARQRQSVVDQLLARIAGEMQKSKRIPGDVLRMMAERVGRDTWGSDLERLERALGLEHGKHQQEGQREVRKLVAATADDELPLFLVKAAVADVSDHTWDNAGDPDHVARLAKTRGIKPEPKPKEPAKQKAAPKKRRGKKVA